jgi:ketosteroid isomerase-like protein
MSRENVEIVRKAVGAFNSGEVGCIFALAHPDFEAHVVPELSAEPDTYRGQDGIQRYFESFREAFEQIRFEAERFSDAGDHVVVGLRMTAIGRLTKIPVEQRNAGVWTVLDGKIARIQTYASTAEALEAVGLEG